MRLVAALLLAAWWCASAQTTGQPLPPWSPGTLDIHQLDTGRGNAALWILPDGTTVLLDAGAVADRPGLELGPRRPNATTSTSDAIISYIRQFSPKPKLDFAIATHLHDDHIAAMPQVAAKIPVSKLIDRGLTPPPPPYGNIKPYLEWRRTVSAEALHPGRADQIVAHAPAFEVRNLAANGVVWTGSGDATTNRFPDNWQTLSQPIQPTENHFSLAFRIRYGNFRYYTGGDVPGILLDGVPAWHDMETPIGKAIGPVDVAVLNHHGWLDTTNETFLNTLQPKVVVIPAWHATHPDHSVMRRLRSPERKPTPPDLFVTSLLEAPAAILRYLKDPFKSTAGHILIRVARGGSSYQVVILESQQDRPAVKAVFGPYPTK